MKIPFVMAVNNFTYRGSVQVTIGTLPTTSQFAVGATLAIPGEYGPSISLAGWSWGGQQYFLANGLFLGPTRSGWIWIWGRPVFASYDVYYEGPMGRDYTQEEDYFYIADIYISGTTIVNGKDFGLPQEITNFFYGGIDKQQLIIPNTALSDGALQPGEHIQLNEIFPYFDRCGADFEVGIPVGAVVLAVLTRVPIPIVMPKGVFPGIDISLSVQGAI